MAEKILRLFPQRIIAKTVVKHLPKPTDNLTKELNKLTHLLFSDNKLKIKFVRNQQL